MAQADLEVLAVPVVQEANFYEVCPVPAVQAAAVVEAQDLAVEACPTVLAVLAQDPAVAAVPAAMIIPT